MTKAGKLLAAAALLFSPPAFGSGDAAYRLVVERAAGASDPAWTGRTCTFLQNALALARRNPDTATECFQGAALPPEGGRIRHEIRYREEADGAVALAVRNLRRSDETDFDELRWTISATATDRNLEVQKVLDLAYEGDRPFVPAEQAGLTGDAATRGRATRELILARGVRTEPGAVILGEDGRYRDSVTAEILDFDQAYARFRDEGPRHVNFLRAAIEITAVTGIGGAWYWIDSAANRGDWQYDFSWETFRKKLITFEAARFDDNNMYFNSPGHPLAGALYYIIGRSNGMTSLESFLFGVAGSAIWELFVEFREVLSVNDMIFTPVAGMAVGEAMFQLSRFFARSEDTWANRILSAVFGGPDALHRWMDKNRPRSSGNLDRHGFTTDAWHRFRIHGGFAVSMLSGPGGTASGAEIGFETELMNVLGYGQPGMISRFVDDGPFTQLALRGTFGEEGVTDFLFYAKAALIGYVRQNIERRESGDLSGYSFFIGPATAYSHSERRASGFTDRIGVVNVLGPMVDLTVYMNGVRVRVTFEVFADFAAVTSYAIEKMSQTDSLAGIQGVLREQRYYFAFGITASSGITVNFHDFELGVAATARHYDSIDGLDRRREELSRPLDLRDTRVGYRTWLNYTLPGDRVKIFLMLERRHALGVIVGDTDGVTEVGESETRLTGGLELPL